MQQRWRILALAVVVVPLGASGCFLAHERADGSEAAGGGASGSGATGGARDPGSPGVGGSGGALPGDRTSCRDFDATGVALGCPPTAVVGEDVVIDFAVHGGCVIHGRTWVGQRDVDAFDHVFETRLARCDGDPACSEGGEVQVLVGRPLAVGSHTLTFGSLSCVVEIVEGAAACTPYKPNAFRLPNVAFVGDDLQLTVYHDPAEGCGCAPRTGVTSGADADYANLELCGCDRACAAPETGYEDSMTVGPLARGTYAIDVADTRVAVPVVDAGACRPVDAIEAVEVVLPSESRTAGTPFTWLHVTGTTTACCADPVVGLRERPGAADAYDVLDCSAPAGCSCAAPSLHRFDAWRSIGWISSGPRTLDVGGLSVTVEATGP